ncbi:MAG: FCD domain-containing protein [Alphaproteobacteria bacterium]
MPEATQISELLQVLQSRSLSSAVQDEIEHRILSGTFRSGQRINENRLAGELRVSRGPIREACRGLVESGLLTVIVNRGFFVRSISLKDAEDVYDVRASLMRLAGATLAARITPSQIEHLRNLVTKMDSAQADEDFDSFYTLNREFHDRIIDFAENDRLRALCDGLSKELHLYRSRSILQGGGLHLSNREHRKILRALASGDQEKAANALEAHILAGKRRFLKATARIDSEQRNPNQSTEDESREI